MRKAYAHTEQTDALIRSAYASAEYATQRGHAVKTAAARLRWPRHIIYRRALHLGVVRPQRKDPPWTEAELQLLDDNAHKCPEVIRRIFKKHGYSRTPAAIKIKLNRNGLSLAQSRIDAGIYTARQLGHCMGVDVKTITRWIEKGLLKAGRQGTARTEAQHGDYWQIKEKHIKRFLIEHTAEINFGKIDKFWLIDVLLGEQSGLKTRE